MFLRRAAGSGARSAALPLGNASDGKTKQSTLSRTIRSASSKILFILIFLILLWNFCLAGFRLGEEIAIKYLLYEDKQRERQRDKEEMEELGYAELLKNAPPPARRDIRRTVFS
jgi:hypothetical protein